MWVSLFLSIQSCMFTETEEERFKIDVKSIELLIDSSVLPKGWSMSWSPSEFIADDEWLSAETALIGYRYTQNNKYMFTHHVLRFENVSDAKWVFKHSPYDYYQNSLLDISQVGWDYESNVADQQFLHCTKQHAEPHYCYYYMRYGGYISRLVTWVWIESYNLTMQDLERIAIEIDNIMREKLLISDEE